MVKVPVFAPAPSHAMAASFPPQYKPPLSSVSPLRMLCAFLRENTGGRETVHPWAVMNQGFQLPVV
jgi:hypothetical protein